MNKIDLPVKDLQSLFKIPIICHISLSILYNQIPIFITLLLKSDVYNSRGVVEKYWDWQRCARTDKAATSPFTCQLG